MVTKTAPKLVSPLTESVLITPPNFVEAIVEIRGTAPYVSNNMSQRAREAMEEAQKQGTQQRGKVRKRAPKDFDAAYKGAMHVSKEGWHGIPSAAFRAAMISACRTVGFAMTQAKLALFVLGDGVDKDSEQPLVRIYGDPQPFNMTVRLASGTADIACRPIFKLWSAKVHLKWDNDTFKAVDVINLLARAGIHCGVGAGRPDSKETAGIGFGTFEVLS